MNQVVHVERVVAAPPESVFALLADPVGWPSWSGHDRGEVVRDASGAEPRGVGSVRAFTLGRMRSVEEVVTFDPPSRFGYVLCSGLPVRGYRADVKLVATPDGGTAVTWHSEFRARVPGTGPLIRRALQRFIERATLGLAGRAGGA